MSKLNTRNCRIDISVDNESNAIFISNGSAGGAIGDTVSEIIAAANAEKLIVLKLDQDDGANVRVVLGKLNSQESSEWIECGSRVLDLSDGILVVSGGNTYVSSAVSEEEAFGGDNEFYRRIEVRPGRYQTCVYTHAPAINGFRLAKRRDWKGFLDWARTSKLKKPYPTWLVEYAHLEGEEVEAIEANLVEGPEAGDLVGFVVQLEPLRGEARVDGLDKRGALQMQQRLPRKVPIGILPSLDDPTKTTRKPDNKQRERSPCSPKTDKEAAIVRFTEFGELLFEARIDDAAKYFIPSLRDTVTNVLTDKRERRKRWDRLSSVTLDTQNKDETLGGWRRCFEAGQNIFVNDSVTDANFVGDLVCQYGSFRSKRVPLVLTAAVIRIDDELQLAGIYFSG